MMLVMPEPNSLIEHWLAVVTGSGEPISRVIEDLSDETGEKITLSQFDEWRGGKRTLPAAVQRIMLADALGRILRLSGIHAQIDLADDAAWLNLAEALMPPELNNYVPSHDVKK